MSEWTTPAYNAAVSHLHTDHTAREQVTVEPVNNGESWYCSCGKTGAGQEAAVNAQAPPTIEQQQIQVLADWWREHAQIEIDRTVPKAVEYGSGDLCEIGHAMGRVMGREGMDEQTATELGIFFYLVGKVARWEQAIKDGRAISDDTIFDVAIYAKMAQRNRLVGGWPWAKGEHA